MSDIQQKKDESIQKQIQGQLVGINITKHVYMNEKILTRGTKVIDASNLEIIVDGEKNIVIFPMLIDYNLGVDIMTQEVRYTTKRAKRIDPSEGNYHVNVYTLEILSGAKKDHKYEKEI